MTPLPAISHSGLVEQARSWLISQGCAVVVTEMATGQEEHPDALGWRKSGSVLVECKVSRDDLRADARKLFRRHPSAGVGRVRYLCTPVGLATAGDVPAGWGWLEWNGQRMRRRLLPKPFLSINYGAEQAILISCLRRIGQDAPTGVSIQFYTFPSGNRTTLGVQSTDSSSINTPSA